MSYRQLAHYVLKSRGRMAVSNVGGDGGHMAVEVWKNGKLLARAVALSLDTAASNCAMHLAYLNARG